MNIEVHAPKLEALLQQRMATGKFETLEELLADALESTALDSAVHGESHRTGAELIAAMQAMPYKDVEFEHSRQESCIRDVEL